MFNAVVCEDPSRRLAPGSVVEGPKSVVKLKGKQVSLLPFDVELPRLAATGFVITFFGQGWKFHNAVGERGCPQLLHITDTCKFIYWAARIEPIDPRSDFSLQLRLVHSPDIQRGLGRGMKQLEHVQTTPQLDSRGGATVYGKSSFNVATSGLLFTDLYCVGSNVSIKWAAMTQHHEDLRWSSIG